MTTQRRTVYDVILASNDHPDVETVFKRARKVMPNISLTTVYRSLAWLVENEFVIQIKGLAAAHFDRSDIPHNHVSCPSCGVIHDVSYIDLKKQIEDQLGRTVSHYDLNIYCTCVKCDK